MGGLIELQWEKPETEISKKFEKVRVSVEVNIFL